MKYFQPTFHSKMIIPILMFIVFADLMAWGVIIPLAPGMFQEGGVFYATLSSHAIRNIFYFLSLGIWGLGAFLGVPFFGDFADKIGRRPVVLISLLGLLATVVWMIISLILQLPLSFVLARFVNGFFSSTFFIAQAMAVDVSTNHNRDRNIGLVMSAAALSWIIAPIIPLGTGLIAKIFSLSHTIYLPFYVMFIVILIAFLLVLFLVPETLVHKRTQANSFIKLLLNSTYAFTDKRARLVYIPFIAVQFGWAVYLLYFPFYAFVHFGIHSMLIQSILFLIGSVGYVLGIKLQNIWIKYRSYMSLILSSIILLFITFGVYAVSSYLQNIWLFGIATFFTFFFNASIYLSLLGAGVGYFKPHEQGLYFGASGSLISLSFAITVVIELLSNIALTLPFFIILGFNFLALLFVPLLLKLKQYA